jgi:hypothetical protein
MMEQINFIQARLCDNDFGYSANSCGFVADDLKY